MFAVDHAATALIVKRRFPDQPIVPLLISVQLMELVWVVLNLAGIERTTTEGAVRSVADVHLAYMPYSHFVLAMLSVAFLAWTILAFGLRRPRLGAAVVIGIASHLVLDLLTHSPDIAIAPGIETPKLGLGLYSIAPMLAFALELSYGVLCWWLYRGGWSLLGVILFFNVANISFFSASIPGPEALLANRPTLIVTVVLVQILVTLSLVGSFSVRPAPRHPRVIA